MSNFPAPSVSWGDIARVCRRVCVLHERGQTEEAERLRASSLPPLLVAVRSAAESEAAITERLANVFALEADRVANAAVLAELLVPALSERFAPFAAAAPPAGANNALVSLPAAAALAPEPTASPEPADPTRAKPAPAKPPPTPARAATISIADFIDDMIAQESPPDRPGHGAQRRAS